MSETQLPENDVQSETETPADLPQLENLRIAVERPGQGDSFSFHLDYRLNDRRYTTDFYPTTDGGVKAEEMYSSITASPFELKLAESLMRVPGLTSGTMSSLISMHHYEVSVHKGKAFTPEEFETSVLGAIAEAFSLEPDQIDVTTIFAPRRFGSRLNPDLSWFDRNKADSTSFEDEIGIKPDVDLEEGADEGGDEDAEPTSDD